MPCACPSRRRGAVAVSVLLGALLALLMCSGATATAAGSGAGAVDTVAGASAAAVSDTGPTALATVGDQQAPGCGKSPGDDSGTGPGTPARGSSSYELLHVLHDARAASGPWGINDVLPAVTPDPGPPPLDPPSPIDLSVLRV